MLVEEKVLLVTRILKSFQIMGNQQKLVGVWSTFNLSFLEEEKKININKIFLQIFVIFVVVVVCIINIVGFYLCG